MARDRIGVALVMTSLLLSGCVAQAGPPRAGGGRITPTPSPLVTPLLPVSPAAPDPPAGQGHRSPPPPAPAPTPRFHGSTEPIGGPTGDRMVSWHVGCPVPVEGLRLLSVDHWGFDGRVHRGELIVNRTVAADVIAVFRSLFLARFPIQRMHLVDEYGGDDGRSMAANNTSAFNCRAVTGGSSWSEHSFGWAIDINPIQNPYVTPSGTVLPTQGRRYADRSVRAKGMIVEGDAVVRAFASVGWGWGGRWRSTKDYQHFSATGR